MERAKIDVIFGELLEQAERGAAEKLKNASASLEQRADKHNDSARVEKMERGAAEKMRGAAETLEKKSGSTTYDNKGYNDKKRKD